jgi:hypothetical protein
MAAITNISKLIVPAYNKGPKDVIDYINNQAFAPVSADVGLVEYPGTFGSYAGVATPLGTPDISVTCTAVDLSIYTLTHGTISATYPLKYWPASGYAKIEDEVFYYTSIVAGASDQLPPDTMDHFIIASTADRGVLGTTAAPHTASTIFAPVLISNILLGATTKIEYNKDQGVFNVWTRTTEVYDPTGYYGNNGWTTVYNTYLIPCPEDVVTFFETSPGVN